MFRGLACKLLDDQIELRKLFAGKPVPEQRREAAVFFRKQRQVALGAAHIARKDHLSPRKPAIKSVEGNTLLRVIPLPAVTFEQKIGLSRSPAPRGILWHSCSPSRAPNVQNGIDQCPSCFDAVAAIKKSSITPDTIVQQGGVSAARRLPESLAVTEIHGDIAEAHFRSGALRPKGDGNPFVRLNVQDQA